MLSSSIFIGFAWHYKAMGFIRIGHFHTYISLHLSSPPPFCLPTLIGSFLLQIIPHFPRLPLPLPLNLVSHSPSIFMPVHRGWNSLNCILKVSPLPLRFQPQAQYRFHQSSVWGTNEFIRFIHTEQLVRSYIQDLNQLHPVTRWMESPQPLTALVLEAPPWGHVKNCTQLTGRRVRVPCMGRAAVSQTGYDFYKWAQFIMMAVVWFGGQCCTSHICLRALKCRFCMRGNREYVSGSGVFYFAWWSPVSCKCLNFTFLFMAE